MSQHFTRGFDTLTEHGAGLLDTDEEHRPLAGYSLLPRLAHGPVGHKETVAWVNAAGRRGLKINPAPLFGGTEDSWKALHPGRPGIRVNLSVPHADLVHTLGLLRHATMSLSGIGEQPSRKARHLTC